MAVIAEVAEYPPSTVDPRDLGDLVRVVQQLVGAFNGEVGDDESAAFPWRQRYDGADFAVDQQRATASGSARFLAAGVNHLTMQPAGATSSLGWTVGSLTAGAITGSSLAISGNATVGGTLGVTGATSLSTLSTSGLATLASASVTGTLGVTGTSTLGTVNAGATTTTALTNTGATTLGDNDADQTIVVGLFRVQNVAGSAFPIFADAANQRAIFGSITSLGSDQQPNAQVIGRLYVAPESANDFAQQWRRSSAATVGWSAGVESTNDFIFKDDGGTSILRIGDALSTYQLDVVTGDLHVADDTILDGDVSASRAVFGGTTFVGGEELRLVGNSRFEGTVGVTTGGVDVTGNSTFRSPVTLDGASLTVAGASITVTGAGIGVAGNSSFDAAVSITNGPLTLPATDPPTANGVATAGSLVKAFGYVTGGGGASLGQNYNISSVARNGTGDFTISIDRDFSAATYAVIVTLQDNGADLIWRVNGQAAGSFDVHFRTTAGVLTDPDAFSFACFGTLT